MVKIALASDSRRTYSELVSDLRGRWSSALNSASVAYVIAANGGEFTVRDRGAVDVLCAKLETILIEHRVRTIVGATLVTDNCGNPLLTIQRVERIVIAWLTGDVDAAALRLKQLGAIYDAYEQGQLDPLPDHRGLGRKPLIVNSDCRVLLDLSDARAASELELVCDLIPTGPLYKSLSAAGAR